MESLNDRVKIKLEEIAGCICRIVKEPLPENIGGLYGGEWGKLLFLCYYAKYTGNPKIMETAEEYTDRLLSHPSLDQLSHTFCDGYAGILYLIEFLKEHALFTIDMEEVETVLENYIINGMRHNFHAGNYDFLHGALGVGYYFLKKGKNTQPIYELVDFLYDTTEKDNHTKCFKWKSRLNEHGEMGYNIALSHGMTSIALFLAQLIKKGVKNDKISELLENTINYILSQEMDAEKYGSYFPSQSLDNKGHTPNISRLGWCYGDLGIAYMLWFSGNVTGKSEWSIKGRDILVHSTKRRELSYNFVVDAGICHGTSGIAMVYRRMFLETHDHSFLDSTDYWMQKTLDMASFVDGLAGFKTCQKEMVCDDNLLTGIAGIGMMMISKLSNDKQVWDELFLLINLDFL